VFDVDASNAIGGGKW